MRHRETCNCGIGPIPIDRTERWTAQLGPVGNLRAPISKCYIFRLQSFIVRPQGPTCHKKRGGTTIFEHTNHTFLANWPGPSTIITRSYKEKKKNQREKRHITRQLLPGIVLKDSRNIYRHLSREWEIVQKEKKKKTLMPVGVLMKFSQNTSKEIVVYLRSKRLCFYETLVLV